MPMASGNKIFRSSRITNSHAIKPVVEIEIITRLVRRLVKKLTSERIRSVLTTSATEKYGKATLGTHRNLTEKSLLIDSDRQATTTN
jgi:hypothetical protein